MPGYDYIRDGTAIYERSFAIIRQEADLARFSLEEAEVAIRMIHACGQVEAAKSFAFGSGFVSAARAALQAGAPILCDAEMVAHGVTRARLPAGNEVICTLRDPRTAEIAKEIGNTRSAAAIELWGPRMAGAVVAIGNAHTGHAGRLRRRGRIEGGAGRRFLWRALCHRARPAGRQRHDGRRPQRAGEAGPVSTPGSYPHPCPLPTRGRETTSQPSQSLSPTSRQSRTAARFPSPLWGGDRGGGKVWRCAEREAS